MLKRHMLVYRDSHLLETRSKVIMSQGYKKMLEYTNAKSILQILTRILRTKRYKS